MAKDKAETTPARKPRTTRGAGERVVLQGVTISPWDIVRAVARDRGIKVKNLEEARRNKALKALIDLLPIEGDDEDLTVWVQLGAPVKAEDREPAILAVLGGEVPGEYRAPNHSAWLGGKRYKDPEQIKLDVEDLD